MLGHLDYLDIVSRRTLDAFLDEAGIALASIDAAQARVALEARIRFSVTAWAMVARSISAIRLHMRWRR